MSRARHRRSAATASDEMRAHVGVKKKTCGFSFDNMRRAF
jgi:hypothetical protein